MANPTRRAVLGSTLVVAGVVAGGAIGFLPAVHRTVAVPPPPPPAELTTLLANHRALLADYRAVAAVSGAPAVLASLTQDVSAHVEALTAILETYPGWRYRYTPAGAAVPTSGSATASPATTAPTAASATSVSALRTAVTAQVTALRAIAVDWPAADVSARAQRIVTVAAVASACLTGHLALLA